MHAQTTAVRPQQTHLPNLAGPSGDHGRGLGAPAGSVARASGTQSPPQEQCLFPFPRDGPARKAHGAACPIGPVTLPVLLGRSWRHGLGMGLCAPGLFRLPVPGGASLVAGWDAGAARQRRAITARGG